MNDPTTKWCPHCQTDKSLNGFGKHKRDGLQSWCKVCRREVNRLYMQRCRENQTAEEKEAERLHNLEWYKKNKAKKAKRDKEYRNINKEKIAEYRKINKEKIAERHKQSLARIKRKDPEKWARTNRHRQIKIKYNLTKDQSLKMLADQRSQCKSCKDPISMYSYEEHDTCHIDHCHVTGKVRGLLCGKCNTGLGYFNDDVQRLRCAISYLEESRRH